MGSKRTSFSGGGNCELSSDGPMSDYYGLRGVINNLEGYSLGQVVTNYLEAGFNTL